MQLSRREIGLILMLLVVGAGSWWLTNSGQPDDPEVVAQGRRPDYVVDGIRGVTMDDRGMPSRRIDAARLRHYPDDGSSELDMPVLEVVGDGGPPWRARSETAWINAAGDEVLLQENVVLSRPATDLAAPIELRTSELLVMPKVDYAETGRFVEIEQGQDWLTGTDGVRAWFGETTRIQVFGRVRTRLEPATDDESP
jgi:lipopolysaccharide export system protein LptC